MSHFKKISTWRERIGQTAEFPLHLATDVERAMVAEIAELRATEGQAQTNAAVEAAKQAGDVFGSVPRYESILLAGDHGHINDETVKAGMQAEIDVYRAIAAAPQQQVQSDARTEWDGWTAAAKALGERAAGHFRAEDYDLQDECLQCASMLYDMRPAKQPVTPSGVLADDDSGVA